MFIDIPDNLEIKAEDFEKMTLVMAKLLMLFCTREKYRIVMEHDPEHDLVSLKKEYLIEKLTHRDEPASKDQSVNEKV